LHILFGGSLAALPSGFFRLRKKPAQNQPLCPFVQILEAGRDSLKSKAMENNLCSLLHFSAAIRIDYHATTDRPTVINLTNHCYFCLSGDPSRDVMDEILYLNAEAYTPVDGNVAVTGEVAKVENTPFDFRTPTRVGDRINDTTHQQIVNGRGYDHNWLLNTHGDIHAVAATLYDPTSGIQMTIYTDQPGVQFYAGNFLDGSFLGKGGIAYPKRSGLCFETQHYPDSPNQPAFPSTTLRPGETYTTSTIYQFGVN
jgi:aldose 1-epimerase